MSQPGEKLNFFFFLYQKRSENLNSTYHFQHVLGELARCLKELLGFNYYFHWSRVINGEKRMCVVLSSRTRIIAAYISSSKNRSIISSYLVGVILFDDKLLSEVDSGRQRPMRAKPSGMLLST